MVVIGMFSKKNGGLGNVACIMLARSFPRCPVNKLVVGGNAVGSVGKAWIFETCVTTEALSFFFSRARTARNCRELLNDIMTELVYEWLVTEF
jgi:hypothetical protein